MTSLSKNIINSRADLDALIGTPAYTAFMLQLKSTITQKQDIAIRPENYGQPGYDGETIPPIWSDVKDLSTIERFGFTKADFI